MNKRNIPVGVSDFSEIRQKNESLFQGLAVSSDSSLCKEWMNQWPVVFLSVTCSHHLNLTILKWGLPARLPFKAKLKQAIPACPAVLFFIFIRLRIFFLCRQAHSL